MPATTTGREDGLDGGGMRRAGLASRIPDPPFLLDVAEAVAQIG
jgi:hypothetical protein